ncbi:MAG: hypothetical protein IIA87_03260 [Nanoarchaeota archaeon]|nr:hypothetical protein [Nanoarchaeota archaeon]
MEFKVGDKVKVSASNDHSASYNGRIGTITIIDGSGIPYKIRFDEENQGDCVWVRCIETLENISTAIPKSEMVQKTVFNVLVVDRKTGKVEKDVTVIAEGESNAILAAYGIKVENLQFKVTERTSYEEQKPQTVILDKGK